MHNSITLRHAKFLVDYVTVVQEISEKPRTLTIGTEYNNISTSKCYFTIEIRHTLSNIFCSFSRPGKENVSSVDLTTHGRAFLRDERPELPQVLSMKSINLSVSNTRQTVIQNFISSNPRSFDKNPYVD